MGLPVTHLDLLRCEDTFDPVDAAVYRRRHDAVLARDEWIIEGIPREDSPTSRRRLADCDAAVFLDRSPWVALWRSWRRSREHAPDGAAIPLLARYRFNAHNVKRSWNFYFRVRPRILGELSLLEARGKLVLIARDDRELEAAAARLAGDNTVT